MSIQGKTGSVYCDLRNAFDIVHHNLLFRKLTNFRLSSGYVDGLHSYLNNRQSSACIPGNLSCSCVVKIGVSQGSTLGPLLFIILINDICNYVFSSEYLLFVADLKIHRSINNVHDCKLLQSDTDSGVMEMAWLLIKSQVSSVNIVFDYRLHDQASIPGTRKGFLF
jgi:hypothetical protein